jgi:hypothetical protein
MWNQEQQIIKSEISSSEQLLWVGRPRQGIFFRPTDVWAIPFSLLYLGFLVFVSLNLWSDNSDMFSILLGVILLFFGLYLVIGRFFDNYLTRKKTYYGITNERIVIVSGIFSQQTKFIDLEGLNEITFEETSNGLGTITFGREEIVESGWLSTRENQVISAPKFEQIPQAKNVYEIIRNAQKLLR